MQKPLPPVLAAQLDLVEQQFSQVAAFLARGDATALQGASATLQSHSAELSRLLQAKTPNAVSPAIRRALRLRLRTLAAGLQSVRDNLSRQAAFNQQALSVVLPTPAKSTYAGGSPVYGAVARQVGVHKFLAA